MSEPARIGGWDYGRFADPSVLVTLSAENGIDATKWVVERVTVLPLRLTAAEQIHLLQPELDRIDHLALDAGGSGQSLPEQVRGARLRSLVPFVITGGSSQGRISHGRVCVGKTRLIKGMLNAIHNRELKVAENAVGRDYIMREMRGFEFVQNERFRKTEAKQGAHDDSVMALALAIHLARRVPS